MTNNLFPIGRPEARYGIHQPNRLLMEKSRLAGRVSYGVTRHFDRTHFRRGGGDFSRDGGATPLRLPVLIMPRLNPLVVHQVTDQRL